MTSQDLTYSVITPCLNSEDMIGRCIDSVLKQRVPPKEYVFVDGRSTDATLGIVRAKIDGHVREGGGIRFDVVDQGGAHGIAGAFNMGLEWCSGDLIFILNSDDWYEPHCAETVLQAMRDNPETDIVAANLNTYEPGGAAPCGRLCHRPDWMFPVLMPVLHPACFIRRRVYDEIGYYDPAYKYNQDYDFMYRCKSRGKKILRLPDALVNFQLGGRANSHRGEARLGTYRIARRHGGAWPLTFCALAARFLTGR